VSVPKKTTSKSGKKPTSDTQGVEGVVYKVLKHLILVISSGINFLGRCRTLGSSLPLIRLILQKILSSQNDADCALFVITLFVDSSLIHLKDLNLLTAQLMIGV
jgi:hypothetical protein